MVISLIHHYVDIKKKYFPTTKPINEPIIVALSNFENAFPVILLKVAVRMGRVDSEREGYRREEEEKGNGGSGR